MSIFVVAYVLYCFCICIRYRFNATLSISVSFTKREFFKMMHSLVYDLALLKLTYENFVFSLQDKAIYLLKIVNYNKMNHLPIDLICEINKYLNSKEKLNVSTTCKFLYMEMILFRRVYLKTKKIINRENQFQTQKILRQLAQFQNIIMLR